MEDFDKNELESSEEMNTQTDYNIPGDEPVNTQVPEQSANAEDFGNAANTVGDEPQTPPAPENIYKEPPQYATPAYGYEAANENVNRPASSAPVMNRINYTVPVPVKDRKPFSKGLKVFCLALAAVVIATTACVGGYYLGRSSNASRQKLYKDDVKIDLASKPKDTAGMTATEVYDAVNPSIVGIRVYNSKGAYDASGVIYTSDGYVITNDHIYENVGAPKFKIYTFEGEEYDAQFVAGDSISDLCVLKINGNHEFKNAEFGNSGEIVCGETVFAIGRPSDASDITSITSGTVSVPNRRLKSASNYPVSRIQTDSPINPGSSGGALCNVYGQVIGITTSKQSGADYDSVSYSVPSITVKRVVDQLISSGKVLDRAKLGITYLEINSVNKDVNGYAAVGLLVQSVNTDSSIYGKIDKGDIITHVNGVEITKDDIMLSVIESAKAGDEITITVLSASGSQSDYVAKLGANVGESSYKESESDDTASGKDDSSSKNDGTFDFPFGY